jgi:Mg-chelatase subunit ChlD
LRSTETFIDLIDSRRFDTNPPRAREDQFSLTTFSNKGNLLFDLTLDYETLKNTLFTGIVSDYDTNMGDGMRVGIDTLTGGRSNSIHFMVLLSDGWPNRYGSSGTDCPTGMPCPETFTWIDQQIEYATQENVTVFTIGLGNSLKDTTFSAYGDPNYTGQKLLERIAEETGGTAYHAPTTEELEQIFEWIAEAIFVRLKG